MLRLLHTSDWHLGAAFHGQDRSDEEQDRLDRVVALAKERAADAVIIAGDVFDTPNPPAEAQRRYYTTLHRLVAEAGVASVLVIAGNHDHGLRLEGPRPLLAALRIAVRGDWPRDASAQTLIVPLADRAGVVRATAALVPYLRESDLVLAATDTRSAATRAARACEARLAEAVAAAAAAGLPVVLAAHLYAKGGQAIGNERLVTGESLPERAEAPDRVGGVGLVELDALAPRLAYAALGHLHQAQRVAGHDHLRYCGSLTPQSFAQTAQPTGLALATIYNDRPALVESIALPPFRSYQRVRCSFAELERHLAALAPPLPGAAGWMEVVLEATPPQPGIAQLVMAQAERAGWQALSVRRAETAPIAGTTLAAGDELDGLAGLDPERVFRGAWREAHGDGEPDPAVLGLFRELAATASAAAATAG